MIPLIALVGRPNVGKSTLFNRLTRTRRALVDDTPGLTRDRQYGTANLGGQHFRVVDTGGFLADPGETMASLIRQQALVAVEEADAILLVADGRDGPMPDDHFIAELLRRSGKPVVCAVNKSEGNTRETLALQFHELGLAEVIPISAAHGLGMDELLAALSRGLELPEEVEDAPADATTIRVAVVGSPNAGKSSLINRLLGEERLVTSDIPGTTRDAVMLPYTDKKGRPFELVDTAGIRRKARIALRVEKYSVIAALKAMDQAHVAILVLDALRGITVQDLRIASHALEAGCGLILAINKWDLVVAEHDLAMRNYRQAIHESFPRFTHAPVVFCSAVKGLRIHKLTELASQVWENHQRRVATSPLNRWLEEALNKQPPPRISGGRVIKFRYATQVAVGPPTLTVFTNFPEDVPDSYQRYLENQLRQSFPLSGTPVRLFFRRSHDNRYDGK
ncbi:MAG: ribosome biogenesis GTPase Der [Magnetococcales bacterium]|nr:ribosome biogenesis GTPase Der [Magnetococcales bacterium]NGZ27005.1 ribosome biogenesis GTPase Der [Magnetococcales bacterium]